MNECKAAVVSSAKVKHANGRGGRGSHFEQWVGWVEVGKLQNDIAIALVSGPAGAAACGLRTWLCTACSPTSSPLLLPSISRTSKLVA